MKRIGRVLITMVGVTALMSLGMPSALAEAPTITSFSPTSGPAGTVVTVNGTGFVAVTSVAFNGTLASFTVDSSTQITATVPDGATTGPIAVTTAGGTATSVTDFTVPVTFTVNSNDDINDGSCDFVHCSLREAILAANANPGEDLITFDISGGALQTIQPTSQLPHVTDAVTIDSTTQPGYAGTPVIELDGSAAGSADGLKGTETPIQAASSYSCTRPSSTSRLRTRGASA